MNDSSVRHLTDENDPKEDNGRLFLMEAWFRTLSSKGALPLVEVTIILDQKAAAGSARAI